MTEGCWLNDRYIAWQQLEHTEGTTPQEKSAISFILDWRNEKKQFHAFTSGSTGQPKKITFDRETAQYSASCTLQHFKLDASDTALICMDVSRIAGRMMIVRALQADMAVRITEPSRNPNWDYGTFTACAPLQLETAIEAGNIPESYKCILVGGAPMSAALIKKVSKLPVYETYGMTETLSHIAVRPVSENDIPFTCIQPVELRVDDRDCLALRGRITNHDWVQTNDRVKLLDGTSFYWLGRADHVINSGGIKVQPEKLEETLAPFLTELGIKQFFIHGFPHPKYGESPVLIVERTPLEDENELLLQIKNRVERYHHPLKIIQVPAFQYGPTGKILRKETAALIPPFTF